MAYTYLTVCNETLRRLNEVEMNSTTFSGAKGVQALVKDFTAEKIQKISATNIRKSMRKEGKLK